MKRWRWAQGASITALVLSTAAVSLAAHGDRDEPRSLAAVERAYREIDFELTAKLAAAALAKGGHDTATTARLQLLLGLANAALGRSDEAHRAFVVLLAIDPNRKLDRELSPKVRAPYLEAQGYWASFPERLTVGVRVDSSSSLALTVADPADLVKTVRVSFEVPGQDVTHVHLENAPKLTVPLPRGADSTLECTVTLLDGAGNSLHERPYARAFSDALRARVVPPRNSATMSARSNRAPWLVTSAGLALAGLGATAAAAAFHVDRERQAARWNGADCERPGASRGSQCAAVSDRVRESQRWAIGLYATGGALLGASLITLVLAPSSREQSASMSLRCAVAVSGALACSGSF